MADLEIPPEAIAAQRAYDQADAEVHRLIADLPSGLDVAEGRATISDEQRQEVARARAVRLERLEALRGLPWWDSVASPLVAEVALRNAARGAGPQDAA